MLAMQAMASPTALRYAFATAIVAAGCSGGDSPDAADVMAPTCVDLTKLVVGEAEMCNTLPFPSTRVPFTVGSGSAPSFTGGTLVDGLYAAVKAEGWGTTSGSGRQMGIVLGNGGKTLLWFGQTLNADGTGDVDAGTSGIGWLRANFALTISGNTLQLAEDCGVGTAQGPPELLYTATATDPPQLLLAKTDNPSDAVTTYERQGCP
jgi:hypothetical protein